MRDCLRFFTRLLGCEDNKEGTVEEKKRILPMSEEQKEKIRRINAAYEKHILEEEGVPDEKKVELGRLGHANPSV